ncbi:hypothetical protein [Herminiimonas sp. CN]|uniref:hypothetical protein n=1 Tax=Herminiimonas sp. CN TaxID=1349818 RepID=UPI000473034B|nr:hypothetical protein [Herminiimonas sp. CN]
MTWTIVIAIWFWIAETAYFGWNSWPQSDAEMICDGIAMLMLVIALSAKNLNQKITVTIKSVEAPR